MLWVLRGIVSMKYMLKLIGKKVFTILRSKMLRLKPMPITCTVPYVCEQSTKSNNCLVRPKMKLLCLSVQVL